MSQPHRDFEVFKSQEGQTLGAVVRILLKDASWGQVRKLLHSRKIMVNGNLCTDDARRVKKGDRIRIYQQSLAKPASADRLAIRFIDDHLVVVEKPPGVTTLRHKDERDWSPHRKELQPTLEELLADALAHRESSAATPDGHAAHQPTPNLPPTKQPGGGHKGHPLNRRQPGNMPGPPPKRSNPADVRRDSKQSAGRSPGAPRHATPSQPPPYRPIRQTVRAVHRLDRDTSGLMVFALTPTAEAALIELFKTHSIERRYRAVALGRVEPATFDTLLVRDRGDGRRGSLPHDATDDQKAEAQRAVTHVRPLQHLGDAYTIVECQLETGRTHQIRIHLSEAGHPLCGDKIYRAPATRPPQPTHPNPDASLPPTAPPPENPPSPTPPPLRDTSNAPRQALHAAVLGFTHPITQKPMRWESDWPRDLKLWLDKLTRQFDTTDS